MSCDEGCLFLHLPTVCLCLPLLLFPSFHFPFLLHQHRFILLHPAVKWITYKSAGVWRSIVSKAVSLKLNLVHISELEERILWVGVKSWGSPFPPLRIWRCYVLLVPATDWYFSGRICRCLRVFRFIAQLKEEAKRVTTL